MASEQTTWDAVDAYVCERVGARDAALEGALAASAAAGLPAIQVSANQGKLLMMAARAVHARRILEVGTLGGYSTIWLARGLADRHPDGRVREEKGFGKEGRVVTLEANPAYAAVAQANLERAGVAEAVEVRVGNALDTLPALAGEAPALFPFDLVFIDADKAGTPAYFEWALKMSRPGTMIVVDNVVRDGALVDGASTDAAVVGMRKFFDMLAGETRVVATALQTVGTKGYDGFAVALVVE
jgi:predicted O-methyltransferase YrrM